MKTELEELQKRLAKEKAHLAELGETMAPAVASKHGPISIHLAEKIVAAIDAMAEEIEQLKRIVHDMSDGDR